jgi:hypothetical protein
MGINEIINDIIGPSKKYCIVFQIFTIIYLIGILMYVGSFIRLIIKGKLKMDVSIALITVITTCLLSYYASRLIYGMCLDMNYSNL